MEVIAESTWAWMLYADGDRRWLAVVCGTVGLYEVVIELDAAECASVARDASEIERLARAIAEAPTRFLGRQCPEVIASEAARRATAAWRNRSD